MRATGMKPSDYYLSLRLRHGAELLAKHRDADFPDRHGQRVRDAGGISQRSVRNNLGVSPSAVRKMARAARMVSKYA